MATLFGGLSRRSHGDNRSSTPNPPDGTAVLSRTQSQWVQLGLFQSINPKFRYQLGKANIVADALSRSRPHRTEDQNIDHPAWRGADEDPAGVMIVQASSAQLSTEELQYVEEAQKTNEELQEMFS